MPHTTGILEQVIALLEETFDISIELYIILEIQYFIQIKKNFRSREHSLHNTFYRVLYPLL